ncbi:CNH domain-containing protein [Chytriomyces sp. MP71]|nr:CNH domain-containing protein [Chytriomyces sp. MP71]
MDPSANLFRESTTSSSVVNVSAEDADNPEWARFLSRIPPGNAQKRMFHIDEIIKNQNNFVNDLKALLNTYYTPLASTGILPDEQVRYKFLWDVFGPIHDIIEVGDRMLLDMMGMQTLVVETLQGQPHGDDILLGIAESIRIGEVFLQNVQDFGSFTFYAESNQEAKDIVLAEMRRNELFRAFIELRLTSLSSKLQKQMQRSRSVSLVDHLTSIIKRFSDYKLNLESVLKRTPTGTQDHDDVEKAIAEIARIAKEMNEVTKLKGDQRKLKYMHGTITPDENLRALNLLDPTRRHIYETTPIEYVKRSGRTHQIELHLLDNYLVMLLKSGTDNPDEGDVLSPTGAAGAGADLGAAAGRSRSRFLKTIYKKPIHIDNIKVYLHKPARGELTHTQTQDNLSFYVRDFGSVEADGLHGSSQTIHQFRHTIPITRENWQKKIEQLQTSRAAACPLANNLMMEPGSGSRASDVVSVSVAGDRLLVAKTHGIYLGLAKSAQMKTYLMESPVLALPESEDISQIDVIERWDLLLVLAGQALYSYSLSAVLNKDQQKWGQRRIAKPVSFFRIGVCDEKLLICAVGNTGLRWQMKLFDPNPAVASKKGFFGSKSLEMHLHKDIFIPTPVTSIDFLKLRVVIGTCRGFEMVHMKLVGADGNAPLLDGTDLALKAKGVLGREDLTPQAMFRTREEMFLLCFQDEGFYVNKNGRLAVGHPEFKWRNLKPTKFVYFAPYIVAISEHLVDVFDTLTGALVQSIIAENVRVMHVLPERDIMYVTDTSGIRMICLKK